MKGCSLIWNDERAAAGTAPTVVGTITDVLEGGAGYLLEVSISESCTVLSDDLKRTSCGKARKALVPLNLNHICNVNVKEKTMVDDPPKIAGRYTCTLL